MAEPLEVAVDLGLDALIVPAFERGHDRRDPLGAGEAVPRFECQQETPRHHVRQGSSELVPRGEDHFSRQRARLLIHDLGKTHVRGRECSDRGRPHPVQVEQSLFDPLRECPVFLERLRERRIIRYPRARQRACQGGGFDLLGAQAPERQVYSVFRELPERRQLAPDDGEETCDAVLGVVVNDVTARNLPLGYAGRVGQWPHTAVGIENVVDGESCARHESVDLVEEVVDLRFLRACRVRLGVEEVVGAPDEVAPHPRDEENEPAVSLRLVVDDVLRPSRKRVHDDVASFGPPDESRCVETPEIREQAVDPGPSSVHHHAPEHRMIFSGDRVGVFDAGHPRTRSHQSLDSGMGDDIGAVAFGRDGQLDTQSLRVRDLTVDEDCRAGEPGWLHPREARQDRALGQNAVIRLLLVEGEHVVGDHPESDQPRWTFVARIERHQQRYGLHEVRSELEQAFAFLERFADQGEVLMLQVSKATVDESP